MGDKVECRSDHAYPGYPVAFNWHDLRLEITEILSEGQQPAGYTYRVRTERHGLFELDFDIGSDQWYVQQR